MARVYSKKEVDTFISDLGSNFEADLHMIKDSMELDQACNPVDNTTYALKLTLQAIVGLGIGYGILADYDIEIGGLH